MIDLATAKSKYVKENGKIDLQAICNDKEDIHTITAMIIFGTEEPDKQQRTYAKQRNFTALYSNPQPKEVKPTYKHDINSLRGIIKELLDEGVGSGCSDHDCLVCKRREALILRAKEAIS